MFDALEADGELRLPHQRGEPPRHSRRASAVACGGLPEPGPDGRGRRVTDALAGIENDADSYVCGHPAMVTGAAYALASRGVRRVFTEAY